MDKKIKYWAVALALLFTAPVARAQTILPQCTVNSTCLYFYTPGINIGSGCAIFPDGTKQCTAGSGGGGSPTGPAGGDLTGTYPNPTLNSSQPNVTSFPNASGIAVASSVTASAFFGNASGLTNIPASQLTGAVPNQSVDLSTVTSALAGKQATGNYAIQNTAVTFATTTVTPFGSPPNGSYFSVVSQGLGRPRIFDVGEGVIPTGFGYVTARASMTVLGDTFVVAGSSFSIAGGSASLPFQFAPGSLSLSGPNGTIISNSSITTTGAFFGDGSHLTGISSSGETPYFGPAKTFGSSVTVYGNLLATGTVNAGVSVVAASSITASAFFGDGSHLTGISATGETSYFGPAKTFGSSVTVYGDISSTGTVVASSFNAVGSAYEMNGVIFMDHGLNLSASSGTFASEVAFTATTDIIVPNGTSAQRPVVISTGAFRFNTTTNNPEMFFQGIWNQFLSTASSPSCHGSGGTITIVSGFCIHTFDSSDFFSPPPSTSTVEVLIVAGGGAGGGGGGGAGGVLYVPQYSIAPGPTTVTIGAGAPGVIFSDTPSNGSNSIFGSSTAIGGGASAVQDNTPAADGGSGGGGPGSSSVHTFGGNGTAGQGHAGGGNGNFLAFPYYSGGGGGAGAIGSNASGSSGGAGGIGASYSISGTPTYYGGGGGGGCFESGSCPGAAGGLGGGGAGADVVGNGVDGTANTGGGGGDSGNNNITSGGGGSGVVIVRYPLQ